MSPIKIYFHLILYFVTDQKMGDICKLAKKCRHDSLLILPIIFCRIADIKSCLRKIDDDWLGSVHL